MVDECKLAEVLSEFARTISVDAPTHDIADRLVHCIVGLLPVSSAAVTLVAEDTAPGHIAASDDSARLYEQLQTEARDGPSFLADATGEAVDVADLQTDARFPRFGPAAATHGLRAAAAFPLRHDSERLGAVALYLDTQVPLGPHDKLIVQTLADVTSAYLAIARARDAARADVENLKQDALRDPLTGLPNRQLLEDRIAHAAEHARRSRTAAAVLFADLDQFKQVNDSLGHAVGDELLIAVAERLSALLRSSDTLARISGDEFVFLCEDLASPEDVRVITDRIAAAFSIPFESPHYQLTITASVGVAYAGAGERISSDLVDEADRAMYQAKRSRWVT